MYAQKIEWVVTTLIAKRVEQLVRENHATQISLQYDGERGYWALIHNGREEE
jgi:hypothetical protein